MFRVSAVNANSFWGDCDDGPMYFQRDFDSRQEAEDFVKEQKAKDHEWMWWEIKEVVK